MELLYWSFEYAKVLFAYLFLMFVFPSILFRKYLRDRDWTFWFGFCVSVQIMLVSTVVLLLGLVGMLNAWVVRGLFYGSLVFVWYRSRKNTMSPRYIVYKIRNRTYGMRLLASDINNSIFGTVRSFFRYLWGRIRPNLLETIVLLVLIVYGMIYFGWGAVQEHIFGASDMPVHHQWTYGLIQGQAFSSGIYPEGMHCFVYALHTLFGVRTFSVMLFLEPVHIIAVLAAIYCMLREIFCWKYTSMLGLAAFLTLRVFCITEMNSTARMQWTLPQEFGLYTVFLIPTFLVRYLKNGKRIEGKKGLSRFMWSEDLVVFILSIAASISSHFYVTIMAVLACAAVVVVWLFRVLHWRRLVPLALSAILALTLSVAPMALAFAEGVPLQGSLYWALGVMGVRQSNSSSETENAEEAEEDADEEAELTEEEKQTNEDLELAAFRADVIARYEESVIQGDEGIFNFVPDQYEPITAEDVMEAAAEETVQRSLRDIVQDWWREFRHINEEHGYAKFFTEEWSPVLQMMTVAALATCILYRLLASILKYVFRRKWVKTDLLDGYAIAALFAFAYILELASPGNGVPRLIENERIVTVAKIAMIFMMLFPVDLVGAILTCRRPTGVFSQLLGVVGAAALVAAVIHFGYYHSFLYFKMQRTPATVNVTNSIIDTIPNEHFTIVSTTDELYQLIEYGYHEELLTFIQKYNDEEYYLPTPYVFFFVEKKALYPNHPHFPDGPEWLAADEYYVQYEAAGSKGSKIRTNEITEESKNISLNLGSKLSAAYHNAANRVIVEANAQAYSELLMKRYPNHCTVYYEDDEMIVYCLEQNPDRLYNLSRNGE